MTHEQIEAIRQRAEAATAGDWAYVPIIDAPEFVIVGENGNEVVTAEVYEEADASFIANARQDIPALLAEVERLQKGLRKIVDGGADSLGDAYRIAKEALDSGD